MIVNEISLVKPRKQQEIQLYYDDAVGGIVTVCQKEDLKDTALDGRDPNHRELLDIHMDTILSGGLFPDGHYFHEK